MKIIIADDDSMIRDFYNDIIKDTFDSMVEVETVDCGEKLVEKVKQGGYRLIITDNNMPPGMNGLEAILEIRKFNKEIPICMISGDGIEQRAKEIGASHYLPKPFSDQDLLNWIRMYINLDSVAMYSGSI